MINAEHLQKMTDELVSRLQGLPLPVGREALQRMVQEVATKLDLVSREDYERLLQIHQRTRQRLDELNQRVTQLEQSDSSRT